MLHLAAMPKTDTVDVTSEDPGQDERGKPVNGSESASKDIEAPTPLLRPGKRSKGPSKPSLTAIREAAQNLDCTGQKVTGSSLAKVFGVSDRTGARYLNMLQTA